jgi:hypothetical protein
VIAVADGAGSASHSAIGASLVCEELLGRSEALIHAGAATRPDVLSLFADARAAVVAEADRLGVPPRELACTAMLCILNETVAAFAQIGDGAIVVRDEDGFRTVFWPEPGEYANATDFLTDERFADLIRFETIQSPVCEVAAFTDGLQRLSLDYSTQTPFSGFFRPAFEVLRGAVDPESLLGPFRDFLESPRVNERTDDDKTLILALRRS